MTTQDAINQILTSIGAAPTNDYITSTDVDVINAKRLLDSNSRKVQRQGWDFNTGRYTFTPNKLDNKCYWDLRIYKFIADDGRKYFQREGYLWDIEANTMEFTQPITGTAQIVLPFDELPEPFQNYIATKTALEFQTKYMPDPSVTPILQQELMEAHSEIVSYDIDSASPNNYLHFSKVAQVMQRL